MPVVEHPLQPESRHRLQLQRIRPYDVVTKIRRVRSGVASMEESQKYPSRLQDAAYSLHHRLHQRLVQVIRNIPAQHSVEQMAAEDEVLCEKALHINSRQAISRQ